MTNLVVSSRPLFEPVKDGLDHINIYSNGKTKLGRMLSHFYPSSFDHPEFGNFSSMECFWHFLKTGCKHYGMRHMNPLAVKRAAKDLPRVPRDDFMEQIKIGNRLKIEQHEEIQDLLVRSDRPFDHYYLFGNGVVARRSPDAQSLVNMFESLRTEFKEKEYGKPDSATDLCGWGRRQTGSS